MLAWSWIALACVLVACGGSSPPAAQPAPTTPHGALTNEQVLAAWAREREERERQIAERNRINAEASEPSAPVVVEDVVEAPAPLPTAPIEEETASPPSPAIAEPSRPRLSNQQIKRLLIEESITDYDGNCPCPYHRASNGSSCGRRSAYSRTGGEEPLCYPKDVTQELIDSYRTRPEGRPGNSPNVCSPVESSDWD